MDHLSWKEKTKKDKIRPRFNDRKKVQKNRKKVVYIKCKEENKKRPKQ